MSNITDAGKIHDGKVVKLAEADPKSKIFTILLEPKAKTAKTLGRDAALNFGVGVLCAVLAVAVLIVR